MKMKIKITMPLAFVTFLSWSIHAQAQTCSNLDQKSNGYQICMLRTESNARAKEESERDAKSVRDSLELKSSSDKEILDKRIADVHTFNAFVRTLSPEQVKLLDQFYASLPPYEKARYSRFPLEMIEISKYIFAK